MRTNYSVSHTGPRDGVGTPDESGAATRKVSSATRSGHENGIRRRVAHLCSYRLLVQPRPYKYNLLPSVTIHPAGAVKCSQLRIVERFSRTGRAAASEDLAHLLIAKHRPPALLLLD